MIYTSYSHKVENLISGGDRGGGADKSGGGVGKCFEKNKLWDAYKEPESNSLKYWLCFRLF